VAVEVGHTFPEAAFVVDPGRVEEFVIAMGVEPQDGYRAVPGAPVPLGFLMYVTTYGADAVHDALGIDFLNALYGGAEIEVQRPVRVGDTLTVRPRVTGVRTKDGASGRLTFVEITCEYLDAEGELAVTERSTTIERG
jgi:acyl dehydratase